MTYISYMFHGVNAAYILLDLFITGFAMRLYHLVYPVVYVFTYLTFNAIYVSCGGTNTDGDSIIYGALDFKGNTSGFLIMGAAITFVAIPLIHVTLFLLYSVRCFICARCSCLQKEMDEEKQKIIQTSP